MENYLFFRIKYCMCSKKLSYRSWDLSVCSVELPLYTLSDCPHLSASMLFSGANSLFEGIQSTYDYMTFVFSFLIVSLNYFYYYCMFGIRTRDTLGKNERPPSYMCGKGASPDQYRQISYFRQLLCDIYIVSRLMQKMVSVCFCSFFKMLSSACRACFPLAGGFIWKLYANFRE